MSRTFDLVMRIVNTLLGLLMMAIGSVWMMQGLNVGPAVILQGFMVNDIRWTFWGAIVALIGVAELIWSNSRRRPG
jgi:hypothetical protein